MLYFLCLLSLVYTQDAASATQAFTIENNYANTILTGQVHRYQVTISKPGTTYVEFSLKLTSGKATITVSFLSATKTISYSGITNVRFTTDTPELQTDQKGLLRTFNVLVYSTSTAKYKLFITHGSASQYFTLNPPLEILDFTGFYGLDGSKKEDLAGEMKGNVGELGDFLALLAAGVMMLGVLVLLKGWNDHTKRQLSSHYQTLSL